MVDPAQKYRITSDGVAYTTVLPNTGRTDKRTRTRRHFVIFPWLWLETLSKPRVMRRSSWPLYCCTRRGN